jgi:endonuclease/exonuclease/phosphatase family metal-dependent hydrolase
VPRTIRVATYNIHKCRGLDFRLSPERIAEVIAELDADVVALQEVLHQRAGEPVKDQVRFIAERSGYEYVFGENREHLGNAYGNATLSRLPIVVSRNYDITWRRRERRGCLRADIRVGRNCLHVFNVHLGTSFFERPHQAKRLMSEDLLLAKDLKGPRIVVGDFNEWTRGIATRVMGENFASVDYKLHARRRPSYPGVLPILHLDHFYFDQNLELTRYKLHKSRKALIASDHLPIVADFEFP